MTSVGHFQVELDQEQRENELNRELDDNKKEVAGLDNDSSNAWRIRGKRTLLAAEKGRLLELARLVGADRNLINYTDADNYTPLHRASYGGHKDCVKYLVLHGSNIDARTNDGWTPLHCAVRWNNIDVAEYLISRGADVNAISTGGNTPLHIVASNGRYSITCDIIQMLLYHPDCDFTVKNNSGDTAYDIAKRSGPFWKLWSGVMTLKQDNGDED